MAQTLVVLHGGPFSYQNVQEFLNSNNVASTSADITTEPAALGAAAKYSKALLLAHSADGTLQPVLSALNKLLTPGASVVLTLLPKQVCVCQAGSCWIACSSSATVHGADQSSAAAAAGVAAGRFRD